MAAPVQTGLAYPDLHAFPDDNLRRELIGGDLFVTPAPRTRHQAVITQLVVALGRYAEKHGGSCFTAPLDVVFTDRDVVEPDVLFVSSEHSARIEEHFVRGAPDVVVEVSSPSTRSLDLGRKRDLYERHGVPDYWYIDLDSEHVETYRLDEAGRYAPPVRLDRGDTLTSRTLPGFEIAITDILVRSRPA